MFKKIIEELDVDGFIFVFKCKHCEKTHFVTNILNLDDLKLYLEDCALFIIEMHEKLEKNNKFSNRMKECMDEINQILTNKNKTVN